MRNYKDLMKYGPPTDQQRHEVAAYTDEELDDAMAREDEPVRFGVPDGITQAKAMQYGPPSPFNQTPSLEKWLMKNREY